MPRKFKLVPNDKYEKCPKCGNNQEFTAHSSQCTEDACEVWVVCKCGYDPTQDIPTWRFEDVWGGTDDGNCLVALDCWNDIIQELVSSS